MIPIYQTEFTKRAEDGSHITRGNCFAACVCSILGLPIDEFPRVQDLPPDGTWFKVTSDWLNAREYRLDVLDNSLVPEYYSIANGPSPRGPWRHSVVYFGDRLLHDPYPFGGGLPSVDDYHVINPL